MSASAIALVLGSAFIHAAWNARANAGGDRVVELTIAYLVGFVALGPWLLIDPPSEVPVFVASSGLAHGGYIAFLARAYDRGGLATTYPVARGTAPLLVAVAGVWVLDQTPSIATVLGAAAVALGLVLIGGVALGRGERSAVVMALVTGGFIAAYTLLDARGVEETGELGYFAAASLVASATVMAVERPGRTRLRASLRAGLGIGVASTTAYALVLLAYTRADAADVAALRGTSILFGLALVPRTLTPRLVVGAGAVVAGAALVVA